jgi:hypothetical protein
MSFAAVTSAIEETFSPIQQYQGHLSDTATAADKAGAAVRMSARDMELFSQKLHNAAIESEIAERAARQHAAAINAVSGAATGNAKAMAQLDLVMGDLTASSKGAKDVAAAYGEELAGHFGSAVAQAIIANSKMKDSLKEVAAAAAAATGAFGEMGNGLARASTQLDNGIRGLQGVAWEMRHATEATKSWDDSQKALIETMAKASDTTGSLNLWTSHLLAQLENGTITVDQYKKAIKDMIGSEAVSLMGNYGSSVANVNRALEQMLSLAGKLGGGKK